MYGYIYMCVCVICKKIYILRIAVLGGCDGKMATKALGGWGCQFRLSVLHRKPDGIMAWGVPCVRASYLHTVSELCGVPLRIP